jgi:hypothetical protein
MTAIEWLLNELPKGDFNHQQRVIKKAKVMERNQIINAQECGFTEGCRYTTGYEQTKWNDGKHYFKETYNK